MYTERFFWYELKPWQSVAVKEIQSLCCWLNDLKRLTDLSKRRLILTWNYFVYISVFL